MKEQWQKELEQRVCRIEELGRFMQLTPAERLFFDPKQNPRPCFAVTHSYLEKLSDNPGDPLRKLCVPTGAELKSVDYESRDPLAETGHSPLPRLVHRYSNRVLIKVTDECALYCRHCFRKGLLPGRGWGVAGPTGAGNKLTAPGKSAPAPAAAASSRGSRFLSRAELEDIVAYIGERPELREVILSGGDPLILKDGELEEILSGLSRISPRRTLRLSSRVPIVLPSRITDSLLEVLRSYRPLWFVLHVNHPREFEGESSRVVSKIVDAGIPVLSQSVLLKGINDGVEVLKELFELLVQMRVKPYYLFQPDLAGGTSHLRPSLGRGIELMRTLSKSISGLAMPVYAMDLPEGGGKVRISPGIIVKEDADWYYLSDRDGRLYRYPKEEE